jgi:hypothetical protein
MRPQVNLSARPIHIIVGFRATGKPRNGLGAGRYFSVPGPLAKRRFEVTAVAPRRSAAAYAASGRLGEEVSLAHDLPQGGDLALARSTGHHGETLEQVKCFLEQRSRR